MNLRKITTLTPEEIEKLKNSYTQLNSGITTNQLPTIKSMSTNFTIGQDLICVKPMNQPNSSLCYMDYNYYKIIKNDVFVSLVTDKDFKISKGKKYNVGILEKYKGIRFKNDENEEIELLYFKKYFISLVESRKEKLKKLKRK